MIQSEEGTHSATNLQSEEGPPPPPPLALWPEIVSENPRGVRSALAVHGGPPCLTDCTKDRNGNDTLDYLPTARQTRDGNGNDSRQGKDGNGNGQGLFRSSQLSKGEKGRFLVKGPKGKRGAKKEKKRGGKRKGKGSGKRKGKGAGKERERGRPPPLPSLAFLPFVLESFLSHICARVRNKKFPFIPFSRPFIRKKMPLV